MQERLFGITRILIERGNASAAELAERFDVSRRTIYRDIDVLSSSGVPVYTERGRGGGIYILPEYVLDKALFSKEEQARLLADFEGMARLGTPDSEALLEKLSALFGGRQQSWLEVDFAPWDGGEEMRGLFRSLRQAILEHRVVRFVYMGAAGKQSRREVEPVRIVFRGQGWYLWAFSRERDDWRFFKLTRMLHTEVQAEHFTSRPQNAPPSAPGKTMPALQLHLRFDASLAFRVYDEFSYGQVQKMKDGSIEVKVWQPEGDWLLGFLLSYGPGMEVLAPASLRGQMRSAIAEMGHKYE